MIVYLFIYIVRCEAQAAAGPALKHVNSSLRDSSKTSKLKPKGLPTQPLNSHDTIDSLIIVISASMRIITKLMMMMMMIAGGPPTSYDIMARRGWLGLAGGAGWLGLAGAVAPGLGRNRFLAWVPMGSNGFLWIPIGSYTLFGVHAPVSFFFFGANRISKMSADFLLGQ